MVFLNMRISFDPSNLIPLDDMGTVYPNLRISDEWGILTVENGALVKSDWSGVVLEAPQTVAERRAVGDGWTLELADAWMLVASDDLYELERSP